MAMLDNDYKRMNNILRFGVEKDIESVLSLIEEYLSEKFEYGVTLHGMIDNILIKLSKYPKYFEQCASKYLRMGSNEYIEFILNCDPNSLSNYIGKNIENVDFQNYLDASIAAKWASKPYNRITFIKYMVYKNASKLNIDFDNSINFYRNIFGVNTYCSIGGFSKYHAIFRRLYFPKEWKFYKRDFNLMNVLRTSFYELYHEKEKSDLKRALREDTMDFQKYRWLKEFFIMDFDPGFFIRYRRYFDFEIEANAQSNMLLKYALENEPYLHSKELDFEFEDFYKNKMNEKYDKVPMKFDTLKELPSIIKWFPIFSIEYNNDCSLKTLDEILNNIDCKNDLDLSIVYEAIKRMGLDEFGKLVSDFDKENLQKIDFSLVYKKSCLDPESSENNFIDECIQMIKNEYGKKKKFVKRLVQS